MSWKAEEAKMEKKELLIIMPAHNEEKNLPGLLAQLEEAEELLIAGQVYQKDETSIYLKSVVIYDSNALGQSAGGSGQGIPCTENFICEMQGEADIPLGRTVAVQGIFAPYSHATNPGEFDAAVYYRTLSIGGKLRKAQMQACGEDWWPVRNGLYELKCLLKERLYRIFPEKEAAVMSALLLGDKKDLDSELKDLYKRNGILHILSISSLHITIIGMTVYRLLRRIGLPICPAAVGGSVLLLLYGGMTGFSVSACRAIGMYLIRMFGEVAGRTYDMLTALGVMGAVMAAVSPAGAPARLRGWSWPSAAWSSPSRAPARTYQGEASSRGETAVKKGFWNWMENTVPWKELVQTKLAS